ncbi:MAG: hypothetical protein M4579_004648 [Chaenotheca gracillima]|nr:MAG: hypothetical protein M4579_004648 [Chaenotheca gracillima]
MSSQNQGRQSPSPERQTGAQQQDPPASGKADAAPSSTSAKEHSEETKHKGLESNPKGPLEDAAAEKLSKDGRGDI